MINKTNKEGSKLGKRKHKQQQNHRNAKTDIDASLARIEFHLLLSHQMVVSLQVLSS